MEEAPGSIPGQALAFWLFSDSGLMHLMVWKLWKIFAEQQAEDDLKRPWNRLCGFNGLAENPDTFSSIALLSLTCVLRKLHVSVNL